MLVVMAGLPGAGKSTVGSALAEALPAPVLSVDPVEAAMWRAGVDRDQPTGLAAYVVVEALASELLALGQSVVVDAVNDVEPARRQWLHLARGRDVPLRFVEVICSDEAVHRKRLEARRRGIDGFPEPSWRSIEERRAGFRGWAQDRLVLDSMDPLECIVRRALDDLAGIRG